MPDQIPEANLQARREAEARAFYTFGDPTAEARWDQSTDEWRAKWTREHGRLLSVRMRHFAEDHPVAHHILSGEWVFTVWRAWASPLVWAWRRMRRG